MNRKIAILTTPQFYNYGGILQCYALLTTLKNIGYDATVIDIQYAHLNYFNTAVQIFKNFIRKYFLGHKNVVFFDSAMLPKNRKIIQQNIIPFIEKNIYPKTNPIYGVKRLHKDKELICNFNTFIVGSDQVWRPQYCDVYTYFLGFVEDKANIKKISYAASFGVDNWEFSTKQTTLARHLLRKFYAVSVREKSAVDLCNKYLGTKATHVLDPTMLLKREDYEKIIDVKLNSNNKLMVYVLDIDSEKKGIIDFVSQKSNLLPYFANNLNTEKTFMSARERIVPSLENWLNSFVNSKFVITDSFHGTVFSIIFNIPFVTYGNRDRGYDRFTSLLEIFGLTERLIESKDQLKDEILLKPINWDVVNAIIEVERRKSFEFLNDSLI